MSSLRRPVHKNSTRYITNPIAGSQEFDMFPPLGKTNGFVIHITEAPPPPPPGPPSIVPKTLGTTEHIPRPKPQPPPLAIPPKAYISDDQRPATSPSSSIAVSRRTRALSPTKIPLPRSRTDSSILVRSNSGATPVMRSMFPRYDPNMPFSQQRYRPDIDRVPGLASAMAVAGSSSHHPPSYTRQAMNRPSSAYIKAEKKKLEGADIKESPFRSADNAEGKTTFSSPTQLLDLWDTANGQTASEEVADTYILELSW